MIKVQPEEISSFKFLWIYMATNSLDQDFESSSCLRRLGNWAGMLIRGWTGVFVVALLFLCRDFVDDDWFLRVSWIFLSKLSDKPAYGYRFFPPSLIDLTLLRQLCMKHILWNILDSINQPTTYDLSDKTRFTEGYKNVLKFLIANPFSDLFDWRLCS